MKLGFGYAAIQNFQRLAALQDERMFGTNAQPPASAQRLLCLFLTEEETDAVVGDFTERFQSKLQLFGKAKATRWAYADVLSSVWPLARRRVSMLFSHCLRLLL